MMKQPAVIVAITLSTLIADGCRFKKNCSPNCNETVAALPPYSAPYQAEGSAFYSYTFIQSSLLRNSNIPLSEFIKKAQEQSFESDSIRQRDADNIKNKVSVEGTVINLESDTAITYNNPGKVTIITNGHRLLVRGNDWSETTIKVGYDQSVRESESKELSLYVLKMPKLKQQLNESGLPLINGSRGADAALDERCNTLLASYLESNQMQHTVTCEDAEDTFSGQNVDAQLTISESSTETTIIPQEETLGSIVDFENGSIFELDSPYMTTEHKSLFNANEQPTAQLVDILRSEPSNLSGNENNIIIPQGNISISNANANLDKSLVYGLKNNAQAEANQELRVEIQKLVTSGSFTKNEKFKLSNEIDTPDGTDVQRTAIFNKQAVGSIEAKSTDGFKKLELTGNTDFFIKSGDSWSLTNAKLSEVRATFTGLNLEASPGTRGINGPNASIITSDLTLAGNAYSLTVGANGERGFPLSLDFTSGSMSLTCTNFACQENDGTWTFEYRPSFVNLLKDTPVTVTYRKGTLRGTFLYKATDYEMIDGSLELEVQ